MTTRELRLSKQPSEPQCYVELIDGTMVPREGREVSQIALWLGLADCQVGRDGEAIRLYRFLGVHPADCDTASVRYVALPDSWVQECELFKPQLRVYSVPLIQIQKTSAVDILQKRNAVDSRPLELSLDLSATVGIRDAYIDPYGNYRAYLYAGMSVYVAYGSDDWEFDTGIMDLMIYGSIYGESCFIGGVLKEEYKNDLFVMKENSYCIDYQRQTFIFRTKARFRPIPESERTLRIELPLSESRAHIHSPKGNESHKCRPCTVESPNETVNPSGGSGGF